MPHLLVIDEEPGVRRSLQTYSKTHDCELTFCETTRSALQLARAQMPDVVVMDLCLPGAAGLQSYDCVRDGLPRVPVIVATAVSETDTAIEAMKRGAFDFLLKPVAADQLCEAVSRALEVAKLSRIADDRESASPVAEVTEQLMVGQSLAMRELYKRIGRAARQDVAVLILGESGTGKELAARAVARFSHRAEKPFVAINCAAIPEPLLESELFGYEKGAFTGAEERRRGKFEHADGGTVFLDEIGDMTSATQAKILRLIQEQQFERIGGTETVRTDVRVIAATNKNLSQMVADGLFRQDLFYRVNGFVIEMPPLRQRSGDIPLLANHFMLRFNEQMGRSVRLLAPEVLDWLQMHSWPGNVRELQNTIQTAIVHAAGDVLTMDCLPSTIAPIRQADFPRTADLPGLMKLTRGLLHREPGAVYRRLSTVVDIIAVQEALRYAKGNQLHAAALLGISRTTLRAKLRSLGLTLEKQLSTEGDPI